MKRHRPTTQKDRDRSKQWQETHKHPCLICGTLISPHATFCKKHRPFYKGTKAPNWKGGRVILGRGYTGIMIPGHPKADKSGYVREHILIWEQNNNKPLPKGWVIHHLNGIAFDNRPANLIAMPTMRHNLLLQAKAKRIQELEALLNNQHQLI